MLPGVLRRVSDVTCLRDNGLFLFLSRLQGSSLPHLIKKYYIIVGKGIECFPALRKPLITFNNKLNNKSGNMPVKSVKIFTPSMLLYFHYCPFRNSKYTI